MIFTTNKALAIGAEYSTIQTSPTPSSTESSNEADSSNSMDPRSELDTFKMKRRKPRKSGHDFWNSSAQISGTHKLEARALRTSVP